MANNCRFSMARARYEELAIGHWGLAGGISPRQANRAYDALQKFFETFKDDSEFAQKLLARLLKSNDIRVRVWAASHCLSIGANVEEAETVLEEASLSEEYPFVGFGAKWTLRMWKEQGYLKL